jgi:Protein of unknown function (DUF3237)
MTSRLLMALEVVVPPPQRLGAVPHGTRVIAPIASGPRLRGKVLAGGGDWTLLGSDGVLELDLRITLETDDGALISMTSFGLRHGPPEVIAGLGRGEIVDPARYYFRTVPRFETSAETYAFLNRIVSVGWANLARTERCTGSKRSCSERHTCPRGNRGEFSAGTKSATRRSIADRTLRRGDRREDQYPR